MFPSHKDTQISHAVRKTTENARVRFLPVEEVIELQSCDKNATQTTSGNLDRNATPKCLSLSENNGSRELISPAANAEPSSCFVLPQKNTRSHQLFPHSASLLPMKRRLSDVSQMTKSNFPKYPSNCPALKVAWKGNFEVLDIARFHDILPYIKICEGFVAHCPARVSRKVYNFSKQIAGVLQFKLHPRCNFWPEIFQTDLPDSNDIALYIYPGKFDRSRKKYSMLLKYIEKNDLVLRSCMGSVELMVFASKLLPVESQKLQGSFFMWGVFRHLKGKQKTKESQG